MSSILSAFTGQQEVAKSWKDMVGERLELKHVATRREVFAIGALREARALLSAPPGLRGGPTATP